MNEECFASLLQSDDKPASCSVSMQSLPQDASIDEMEKIVTFDCRNSLGDPSGEEKTGQIKQLLTKKVFNLM